MSTFVGRRKMNIALIVKLSADIALRIVTLLIVFSTEILPIQSKSYPINQSIKYFRFYMTMCINFVLTCCYRKLIKDLQSEIDYLNDRQGKGTPRRGVTPRAVTPRQPSPRCISIRLKTCWLLLSEKDSIFLLIRMGHIFCQGVTDTV